MKETQKLEDGIQNINNQYSSPVKRTKAIDTRGYFGSAAVPTADVRKESYVMSNSVKLP